MLAETLPHPSFPGPGSGTEELWKPSTVGPHGSTAAYFAPAWTRRVGDPVAFTSDLGTSRDTYGGLQLDHGSLPWKTLSLLALVPQGPLCPQTLLPSPKGLAKSIQKPQVGSCLPASSAFRKCLATFRMSTVEHPHSSHAAQNAHSLR